MTKLGSKLIFIISLILFIQFLIQPVIANGRINLDFYYSSDCGDCDVKLEFIENKYLFNESYNDILTVNIKDVISNETFFTEWEIEYDFYPYPFVVIKNETKTSNPIPEYEINLENINSIIDEFLSGDNIQTTQSVRFVSISDKYWYLRI